MIETDIVRFAQSSRFVIGWDIDGVLLKTAWYEKGLERAATLDRLNPGQLQF